MGSFGFFEFALVGVPLTLGVIVIAVLFGERLLPERHPRSIAPDFSGHARTLIEQYELDHPARRADDAALRRRRGGDPAALAARRRPRVPGHDHRQRRPRDPRRPARRRRHRPGETVLAEGDTLLLQGSWAALDSNLDDPEVLVVDAPDAGAPPGGAARRGGADGAGRARRRWWSRWRPGAVPPAVAGLLAACLMILLGVLTVEQAQRGISWTTVVLVGGMISLSTAMVSSGAAGSSPTRWSTWSATPARTRCCSGCSCSPPCSAS